MSFRCLSSNRHRLFECRVLHGFLDGFFRGNVHTSTEKSFLGCTGSRTLRDAQNSSCTLHAQSFDDANDATSDDTRFESFLHDGGVFLQHLGNLGGCHVCSSPISALVENIIDGWACFQQGVGHNTTRYCTGKPSQDGTWTGFNACGSPCQSTKPIASQAGASANNGIGC